MKVTIIAEGLKGVNAELNKRVQLSGSYDVISAQPGKENTVILHMHDPVEKKGDEPTTIRAQLPADAIELA